MDEIKIKKEISIKKIRNKNNIKVRIFQLIFLFLPNIIISNNNIIELTLNAIGNQQIISDKFNIIDYYPSKIRVNSEIQILREKKVFVYSTTDIITISWDTLNDNLTYMFADLSNIVSPKLYAYLSISPSLIGSRISLSAGIFPLLSASLFFSAS